MPTRSCCVTVATGTVGGTDAQRDPSRALQQAAAAASGVFLLPDPKWSVILLPGGPMLVLASESIVPTPQVDKSRGTAGT